MTWVRIDDAALHHEKLLAAGPDAVCLWLAGLCYANGHTTDGAIARGALGALYPSETLPLARAKRAAGRLVEVGLWLETPAGWAIRNYERYQREAMSDVRDRRRAADREVKAVKRATTKSAAGPPHVGALSESDRAPIQDGHGADPNQNASGSESDPLRVGGDSAPSRARDPVPSRPGPSEIGESLSDPPASASPAEGTLSPEGSAWVRAYGAEYQRRTGGCAPSIVHHLPALIASQADPERAVAGFFGTARHGKTRPPWQARHLAEGAAGYASVVPTNASQVHPDEAARRAKAEVDAANADWARRVGA